jgi:N-acetylneuraminate synthase
MKLGSKKIGIDQEIYFIAEMSGNHNQSLPQALKIVDAAAEAGAQALKIQTYTPDTMTLDIAEREFFIEDKASLWKGKSLYQLYGEAMTPWEWHEPIMKRCQERGLDFFSTPFDATAVDFLEGLNVPFYKIASFENTDIPLIKRVARTKKPIIISTGLATLAEIAESVAAIRAEGNENIVLLKCTSAYPAPIHEANLNTIQMLKEKFSVEVGLSDHTPGHTVPVVSACLGATVIEKHFTISRAEGGVDSAFSMEPAEFKEMIKVVKESRSALGKSFLGISSSEEKSLRYKRSLYICEDLKPNDVLTEKNLRAIRPGLGLPPKHLAELLGKHVTVAVKKGTAMSWDLVKH